VVNQPYLFGWRDGTLYLQAYAVMEDDSRDWNKNRKRLLANLMNPSSAPKSAIGSKAPTRTSTGSGSAIWPTPRARFRAGDRRPGGARSGAGQFGRRREHLAGRVQLDGESGLLVDEKTYNETITGKSEAPPAAPAGAVPAAGSR